MECNFAICWIDGIISYFCICTGNNFQHFIAKGCVFLQPLKRAVPYHTIPCCVAREFLLKNVRMMHLRVKYLWSEQLQCTLLSFVMNLKRALDTKLNAHKLDQIHKKTIKSDFFTYKIGGRNCFCQSFEKKTGNIPSESDATTTNQRLFHWNLNDFACRSAQRFKSRRLQVSPFGG